MSPPASAVPADPSYRCDMQDERLDDHEKRLRIFEEWRAKFEGRVAGAAAMGAALASVIIFLIKYILTGTP